jgi:hypothetical protein
VGAAESVWASEAKETVWASEGRADVWAWPLAASRQNPEGVRGRTLKAEAARCPKEAETRWMVAESATRVSGAASNNTRARPRGSLRSSRASRHAFCDAAKGSRGCARFCLEYRNALCAVLRRVHRRKARGTASHTDGRPASAAMRAEWTPSEAKVSCSCMPRIRYGIRPV